MTGSPARPSDLGTTLNRVLATGGAGFTGSRACKAPAQTGMMTVPDDLGFGGAPARGTSARSIASRTRVGTRQEPDSPVECPDGVERLCPAGMKRLHGSRR